MYWLCALLLLNKMWININPSNLEFQFGKNEQTNKLFKLLKVQKQQRQNWSFINNNNNIQWFNHAFDAFTFNIKFVDEQQQKLEW